MCALGSYGASLGLYKEEEFKFESSVNPNQRGIIVLYPNSLLSFIFLKP